MYLLNPRAFSISSLVITLFTFHYVSIKWLTMQALGCSCPYLHSTMYLLNRNANGFGSVYKLSFTFHYVSIKSGLAFAELIVGNPFTFHYVSIKSTDAEDNHIHGNIFTFHYVFIKSYVLCSLFNIFKHLHSTMYLLNLITASFNYTWFP